MKKMLVLAIGLCVAGATESAEARGWRWFCWPGAKPAATSSTSQGARNYSVEPGSAVTAPRTGGGSRYNNFNSVGTPKYLLPKSDPRKYSN